MISLSITMIINYILFTFNINQSVTQPSKPEYPLLPSSWIIGLIWTILIGFMTLPQWILIKKMRKRELPSLVPILFLNCALYPLYSQGFNNDYNQLIDNLFSITLAAYITGRIRSVTTLGSNLIFIVTLLRLFAIFATSKIILIIN
jgi:tryptophan-rich sensory protein